MSQVEDRNDLARKLFARGRLREALDALNQAVRIDPRYPASYTNRADVFERLGMFPQAAADRQRARELAEVAGYEQVPPPMDLQPQPASPPRRVGPPAAPPAPPTGHVPSTLGGGGRGVPWGVVGLLAGVVVIVVALAVVVSVVIRGGGDDRAVTASRTLAQQATGAATATSGPTPLPGALDGQPISFKEMQKAWETKGLLATAGAASEGFSGFSRTPVDVTLKRGVESAKLSIFAYASPDAVGDDWDLTPGKAPAAKGSRGLPAHGSIWWNQNIVVVVRADSDEIGRDALDAFLALSP